MNYDYIYSYSDIYTMEIMKKPTKQGLLALLNFETGILSGLCILLHTANCYDIVFKVICS